MKRLKCLGSKVYSLMSRVLGILFAAAILLPLGFSSEAGIATSKHNLSVTGPGGIKATAETELCIFCHIPHNASPAVPLWNHKPTSAAYTMYTSDYLTRAGYATPSDVGQRSRLCLSCHDGTVAIGSVYTVRGVAQVSPFAMSGVDAAGKIPAAAAGFLGTDLRNDHPVSIKYDTGINIIFGSGSRSMELKAVAPPINPKPYAGVKLYGTASGSIKGYVECTSCHDPHNDAIPKFLILSNTNGALCTTCHDKTGWTGSIHQLSTRPINNPGGETQPIPGATVAAAACMACHKSHSGTGTPYILRKWEENTCFNGTSTSCHGSSGAKNIAGVFGRAKVHPLSTSAKHKNLDVLYYADLGAGNRHAECADCHNSHQARDLPKRTAANSWYPATVDGTSNLVSKSGPLTGVTGVEPTTSPLWSARTTFTTLNAATKEYQICYKCHSYYAIRNAVTPVASWAGLSSAFITDQSWEFSPGNRSAHPVEVGLNSQTGSSAPKPLAAAQMSAPFNANPGTQTMYCSDCHGADNENATDPKGPHGSNSNFMLKGSRKYWPVNATGGLWTLNDLRNNANGWSANLFCVNCHPIYSGGTWLNKAHQAHESRLSSSGGVRCVQCHVVIPHGSQRPRLMGYATDPSPYNYNGAGVYDKLALSSFTKTARTSYVKNSCSTTVAGCH
ncbi:MAG: cytochrome c3 family protein [Smithellaceae bacterium]|nr:cytochrome c3 family protein [Smithellaceae bacterium]